MNTSCNFLFIIFAILFFAISSCKKNPSDVCVLQNITYSKVEDLTESLYQKTGQYEVGMKLGAGNETQEVSLLVDTGSSDVIVKGEACSGCTSGGRYQPTRTAQNLNLSKTINYSSASGLADFYREQVGLQCGDAVSAAIGVVMQSPYPAGQGGGKMRNILGLAYPSKSVLPSSSEGFLYRYTQKNNLPHLFSLLLCGKTNNQLVIGGFPTSVDPQKVHYIPLTPPSFYYISAQNLKVAETGQVLGSFTDGSANCGTVIDSGTTLNMVPPALATAVVNFLKEVYIQKKAAGLIQTNLTEAFWTGIDPTKEGFEVQLSDSDLHQFPTLQIEIGGYNNQPLSINLPPKVYIKNTGSGERKQSFQPNNSNCASSNILGQAFLEAVVTVFDQDNNRIGFLSNNGLCSE